MAKGPIKSTAAAAKARKLVVGAKSVPAPGAKKPLTKREDKKMAKSGLKRAAGQLSRANRTATEQDKAYRFDRGGFDTASQRRMSGLDKADKKVETATRKAVAVGVSARGAAKAVKKGMKSAVKTDSKVAKATNKTNAKYNSVAKAAYGKNPR